MPDDFTYKRFFTIAIIAIFQKTARQFSSKMCSEKRCFLVYIIFSLLIFLTLIIFAGVYFQVFDQENFTVWIQAKALRIEISTAALLENDEIGKYLSQLTLSLQYLRE